MRRTTAESNLVVAGKGNTIKAVSAGLRDAGGIAEGIITKGLRGEGEILKPLPFGEMDILKVRYCDHIQHYKRSE